MLHRRPLPLRPLSHRTPTRHRPHRAGYLPQNLSAARRSGLDPDRQRHGLHNKTGRRQRRTQPLRTELHRLGVTQINSTPNHPTTCGKVERFHQTLKRWLTSQPRATTITELQTQLDAFVDEYNHHRPHRSLPQQATPTTAYNARPKAAPGKPHRHPQPGTPRPRRPLRQPHPAPGRPPAPHRRRTNPRPNPRFDAHPKPRRPNHQRRHRRTHPPANHRPHQGLPTPKRPLRPPKEKTLNPKRRFRAIRMS